MAIRGWTWPLLGLVLGATSNGRAQARDSAGVQIIDNSRPLWTSTTTLRLSGAPALIVGTQPGEAYELSNVAGAVRLGDGTIVVADGSARELRFFDSAGHHVRSVGRRGNGPGEFEELRLISKLAGDTIVAGNHLGRLSYFTAAGTFVRTSAPLPASAGSTRPGITLNHAVLDNQSTVNGPLNNPPPRTAGQRWVDSTPLVIVGRTGTMTAALGTHPYWLWATHRDRSYPVRFSDPLLVATNGRDIFIGYGADYMIRVYSPGGRLERIIRRRWTPLRVTSAEIDRYAAAWGQRWIRSTGAEYERELREFRQVPFAEIVPAFSPLVADRSGRLWVREARIADASAQGGLGMLPLVPSVWNVFDSGGQWLGNVTTPARFLIHEIGADYVLGVARDADGVQTAVMYRLEQGVP
jgi:hypothetical protein